MTPDETAAVLAKCAALDRRTVGRADVLAWHEILADLDLAECLAAVTRWYSAHRDWIMPSDVRRLAHDIARERRRAERVQREAEAKSLEAADPTRRDRSHDVNALLADLRQRLPSGNPDSLRHNHGHWRRLREARERAADMAPQPLSARPPPVRDRHHAPKVVRSGSRNKAAEVGDDRECVYRGGRRARSEG